MVDIAITAANVKKGTTAKTESGVLGETVTAGQTVYRKASDSKYYISDGNSGTPEVRATRGIALNGGSVDQPVVVQTEGLITIGGTVAVGTVYVQSATAGGVAPSTDLASGNFTTVLGIGISATQIDLKLHSGGVAVP